MTFTQLAAQSNNNYRVLVQLDLSKINLQWVNAGAGIWYVNFAAMYPEIDDADLNPFTSQSFGDIGSVVVDTVQYLKVNTLAEITINGTSYFYDNNSGEVYIHFVNNDDPVLHDVFLGVIFGFSYDEFTPVGSNTPYQGRIESDIAIGESRDPLYFGKLQYSIGSVSLVNADGYFDTFAVDNDLYGNQARIYIGFNELDIDDYQLVQESTIEKVTVSESSFQIQLADRRKALSKAITYSCTNKNALEVIREVLALHYGATYNATYYDTTAWAAAEALVPDVTIDIGPGKDMDDIEVIKLIEEICAATFGLFLINPDGRYSFKIVDTTATAGSVINANDIINSHTIEYDPTEVISSAKVGYAKNWEEGFESPYTFYIDTTLEETVFKKYKVYNQRQFNTVLVNLADALAFASTIMAYAKDVHGVGFVQVPINYIDVALGDIVNIQINRPNSTMLGTKKSEIVSRNISLQNGFLELGYRIV